MQSTIVLAQEISTSCTGQTVFPLPLESITNRCGCMENSPCISRLASPVLSLPNSMTGSYQVFCCSFRRITSPATLTCGRAKSSTPGSKAVAPTLPTTAWTGFSLPAFKHVVDGLTILPCVVWGFLVCMTFLP